MITFDHTYTTTKIHHLDYLTYSLHYTYTPTFPLRGQRGLKMSHDTFVASREAKNDIFPRLEIHQLLTPHSFTDI